MSRQVDELVAQHVMGYEPPNQKTVYWHMEYTAIIDLPKYSTDVSDAFDVVDALQSFNGGFDVSIATVPELDGHWEVSLTWTDFDGSSERTVVAYHPLVSMAICLAALRTVGIEVPHEVIKFV